MIFVGFDPGGNGRFGWAVLSFDAAEEPADLQAGVCAGATSALNAAREVAAGKTPLGVGVDAPLFWTAAGDRGADTRVRALVCGAKGQPGTVSHVNSLRGACLVQGVLVAHGAADLWPETVVTEAHPKALLRIMSLRTRKFLEYADALAGRTLNDHERDAALAAYAARAAVRRHAGWQDLVDIEPEPFFPGGRRVSYWFPVEASAQDT